MVRWRLRRMLWAAMLVALSQCTHRETTHDGAPGSFHDLGAPWTGDGAAGPFDSTADTSGMGERLSGDGETPLDSAYVADRATTAETRGVEGSDTGPVSGPDIGGAIGSGGTGLGGAPGTGGSSADSGMSMGGFATVGGSSGEAASGGCLGAGGVAGIPGSTTSTPHGSGGVGTGGTSAPPVTGTGGSCAGNSCADVVDGGEEAGLDGGDDTSDAELDGACPDSEADAPLVADIADIQEDAGADLEADTEGDAEADAETDAEADAQEDTGADADPPIGCLPSGTYSIVGDATAHGMSNGGTIGGGSPCNYFGSSAPATVVIEVAGGVLRTIDITQPPPVSALIKAYWTPAIIAAWPSWTITANTPEHLSANGGIVCGTGPPWPASLTTFTLEVDCLARTLTLSGSCEGMWPSGCFPDYIYEITGQATLP